jgi:uncharacterized protein (TIGR02453 family)
MTAMKKPIEKFKGFTDRTQQFLQDLTYNNNREWFRPRKEECMEQVMRPLESLGRETRDRLAAARPDREYFLHVCRIYRDARRLGGRGPYKTEVWFTLHEFSGKIRCPTFYFSLKWTEFAYGMEWYAASARQMEIFRKAVDSAPGTFSTLLDSVGAGTDFDVMNVPYQRKKKDLGDRLNPWYNCRYLDLGYVGDWVEGESVYDADLPAKLADAYEKMDPLYRFILAHCPMDAYRD